MFIVPTISVEILDGGASPLLNRNYSLQCRVSGPGLNNNTLSTSITYQWTKNCSNSKLSQNEINSSILTFSSIRLSDAGQYICLVTASSSYFNYSNINITASWNMTIQSKSLSVILYYSHV